MTQKSFNLFARTVAASLLLITLVVNADDDLGVARGFNAFVEQDFQSQYTDIQGKLAAGGDIDLLGYGTASSLSVSASTPVLIAGNNITYNNGMIFSGSVIAGGSAAGINNNVRNGMVAGSSISEFSPLPFDFSEEFELLREVAVDLSEADATGSVVSQWGSMTLTGDCSGAVQVFHLDGPELLAANDFEMNCVPSGATIIFNVSGSGPGLQNIGLASLQPRAGKILWNFYEAATVNFSSVGVEGSVLAPNADLDTPWSYVNGTVMVKSWSGYMELHHIPFTGDISTLVVNEPPVIISTSPLTNGIENSTYTFPIIAEDLDSEILFYRLENSPAGMAIDSASGEISWVLGWESAGVYSFDVLVKDEETEVSKTFELTVENVNRTPVLNPIADISIFEAQLLSVQTQATDPDGDTLVYSLTGAPAGMSMDTATGVITWQTGYEDSGVYPLQVQVTDGEFTLSEDFILTVVHVNRAPILEAIPTVIIQETQSYQYQGVASDSDGDAILFSLVDAPAGISFDSTTGIISWATNYQDAGVYPLQMQVSDGELTAVQDFTISVENLNRPPTITSEPEFVGFELSEYQYDVNANDADLDDVLTHSIDLAPLGFAMDPETGLITWSPTDEYVGSVENFNSQCYVVPTGGITILEEGDEVPDGRLALISPLFKQVKEALDISAEYTAREGVAWDVANQGENCLGCHIQTQSLVGLATSIDKANVDLGAVEHLLATIIDNQEADGRIVSQRSGHRASYLNVQNSLALWALSAHPDRARTFDVRVDALSFFLPLHSIANDAVSWVSDHETGWLDNPYSITALAAQVGSVLIDDINNPEIAPTEKSLLVAQEFNNLVPGMVRFFLNGHDTPSTDLIHVAFRLVGLSELKSHIVSPALLTEVDAAIDFLDAYLRSITLPDGGWALTTGNTIASPVASVWAGFALDYKAPDLTDPIITRNIEYLLSAQLLTPGTAYGTWHDSVVFPQSSLGTTSIVLAYLPVALDFLGNADLYVGNVKLYEQGADLVAEVIVGNRGLQDVATESSVSLFAGTNNNSDLLATIVVPTLKSGASITLQTIILEPSLVGDHLYTELRANTAIEECEINNNHRLSPVVHHRVTDIEGLFDRQIYALSIEDVNAAPVITSNSSITHQQGQIKSIKVTTSDSDIGDAATYSLAGQSSGIFIDDRTGQILVDGALLESGEYTFTVIATDLRGASTQQDITFTIEANLAPTIVSIPVQQVLEGSNYFYDVDAIDPNKDELKYYVQESPLLTSIASNTGVVQSQAQLPLESLRAQNQYCEAQPNTSVFDAPALKWHWSSSAINPSYNQVMAAPIVVQVNDDNGDGVINVNDTPDVIFTTFSGGNYSEAGVLRAVSGVDGSELWSTDVLPSPFYSPAAGDIDGDGVVEIVIAGGARNGTNYLLAYENDGTLKWQTQTIRYGTPYLVDLEGDGNVEIIYDGAVFDSLGTEVWDGVADATSFAFDSDLDGDLEVYSGGNLYQHDGELIWSQSVSGVPFTSGNFSAVGNFDDDDFPEIVIKNTSGSIMLLEHNGDVAWGPVNVPGGGGGAITVADVDNDGEAEIGIAGAVFYVIFESNGDIKWQTPTSDTSSRSTGSTVFDFNGDGRAEIVYADEQNLRIYDAQDELTLITIPNPSGTLFEYPLVVDIDNDNHAELVVISNNYAFSGTNGIRVFESATDLWAPTRGIWNQYNYNINNVNDDGTIPRYPQPSWLTHNTYRLNTFLDRSALSQPDLAAFELRYNDNTSALSSVIINRGLAPINANAVVTFYSGDPDSGGIELGAVTLTTLAAGQESTVSITIDDALLFGEVFVDIQYDGSTGECITENNRSSAKVVRVGVTDEGGLGDTQTYLYSVVNVNSGPEISSVATSTVELSQSLSFNVEVVDPDLGDAHLYALHDAPEGISINAFTGVISIETTALTVDSYTFTIVVTDLSGKSSEQTHVLNVTQPDNLPPVFGTMPTDTVSALDVWAYTVQATDPDGDTINYGLDTKPTGMTIDAVTGEMYWQPTREQLGINIVDIIAVDDRGASAHQRFTVDVTDAFVSNAPPQITSIPSGAVTVGRVFSYPVIASDPDGDALTYFLEGVSGNMSINAQGQFTWLPEAYMVGQIFTVTIKVEDGRGGYASQNLSLPVNEASNNPPRIDSTPGQAALVDTLYQYQIIATDDDGDAISYSFGNDKPNGMLMSNTGLVTWTPSQAQSSQIFNVIVKATDARGAASTQSYGIAVNIPQVPNDAPFFTSAPTSPAVIGEQYTYQALATDPDNDVLTFALSSASIAGLVVSEQGLLTWAPVAGSEGDYPITISVTDGRITATQSYTLTVVEDAAAGANNYPVINSQPLSEIVATEEYVYQVDAVDPDGDSLTYELLSSSIVDASISPEGLFAWTTTTEEEGVQTFQVKVSDGQLSVVQTWSVRVWDKYPPLRLFLDVSPAQVNIGDEVFFSVATTGGSVSPELHLFVDGVELALDTFGKASLIASNFGLHQVVVTADSGEENRVQDDQYLVLDPSDVTAPVVNITTPTDTSIVTAPTDIIGSVSDFNLVSYELFVSPKGEQRWSKIGSGNSEVVEAELGVFDPTMMLNGTYDLVLVATDVNGQTAQDSVTIIVDGEMKVGHFTITFEDVSVDLAGIPVRVTRTYDTRRKDESLDFGYGWSVDYQNVRIQESRTLGFSWQNKQYRNGFFGDWCIEANGDPIVSITLPDGSVERFKAKANPECSSLVPTVYTQLGFEAMAGTYSTLTQNDYGQVRLVNGNIVDIGDENTLQYGVNPDSYTLTTKEGLVYHLDQKFGIRRVEEPGGQFVTYSESGIEHSSGYAIDFERDSLNRIVALILPDGRRIEYDYTLMGDLAHMTDLSGDVTRYSYMLNQPHYLDEIIDPRGVTATRMEYDEDGRLTAVIDAEGNRVEYTHDIAGRTELIKDPRGNQSLYIYDDEGRVLVETNALGETTTRTYNAVGDVLSETNDLGETRSWTFDNRGNTLSETDPLGNVTTFVYDDQNEVVSETNALGITPYTNSYNTRAKRLLSTTDAMGNTTSFKWDTGVGGGSCQTGSSRGYTDALGNHTDHGVICYGPLAGMQGDETDANGVRTAFIINETTTNRTATVTWRLDADGNQEELRTDYEYDAEDRVIKTTYPDGSTSHMEYNSIDQVVAEIDTQGRRTEYTFDARGQQTQVLYSDGSTESKTYDAAGNVVSETNKLGQVTTYVFDAANRQTSMTSFDGSTSSTEYDAAGRVVATIDALGNRTETEYDAAGRRTLVRDAQNNEMHYEYDAGNRMVAMVDALGRRVEYVYNDIDQRTATIYADNSTSSNTLDALSRKTAQTDQAGVQTQYEYDPVGRLVKVIDVLGQETTYGYDEQGNKTSQTDALGRTTQWQYDLLGRNIKRILPMGQEENFAYNDLGQRVSHTDFNGDTTVYAYDESDRVAQITYADGSEEAFVYDVLGNRTEETQTSAEGDVRTTTYVYDSSNRLAQETQANGAVITYAYDLNGNRTQVVVQSGGTSTTTDYSFDSLNRLQSVTSAEGITSYGYDAVGNRTSISYPNGSSQVYTYNELNRLAQLQTFNGAGALVEQYDYTLHSTGRRTQIDELDGRSTSYIYDSVYRLTEENITDALAGNYLSAYTYDAVGNRLTKTVDSVETSSTYDDNDRITISGLSSYVYDANGNTLTATVDGSVTTYTYNSKNQLVTSDTAANITNYAYNTSGIRTEAGDTEFIVDSNRSYAQVLLEIKPTGNVSYTYGDDLISQNRSAGTFYFNYDGLGSTRSLSDAAGNITDTYDYEAFGEVLNETGATENSYKFTGEQYDSGLGQYYLRARYYDQGIGRFTQMDTWMGNNSDPVTLHKYIYGNADPAGNVDPSGHMSLASFGAANNIAGTLMNMSISVGRLIQFVEKVDTVVSLYNTRSALFRVASYIKTQGFEDTLRADKGFANALNNYEEGLSVLGQNIGKVYSGLSKSRKVREFIKSPKNDLLIYGPTPESDSPWFSVGTRIPIGSIRLGKSKRKIFVELGRGSGQGGRFTGLGHTQGTKKKGHVQWFRMDWHKADGAEQWRSENYHFHLKK